MITDQKVPSRGTYSFTKAVAVFLCVVLMRTGCEAKNNLKNIAETYKGDGVASYIKRPAFFASDGFRLDFEKFSLSEGFNKELLISGLPPVKHNSYGIYLSSNKKIEEGVAENIFTDIVLKDKNGNVVWHINTPLKSWRTGTERRDFFYLSYDYGDEAGWLVPDEDMSYTLLIQCRVNEALEKTVDGEAHFFLSAGGYK